MISLFRNGRQESLLVLLFAALLCNLPILFKVGEVEPALVRGLVFGLFADYVALFALAVFLMNTVLVIIGAYLLFSISEEFEMGAKANFLPAFCYILLCSLFEVSNDVNSVLFANSFLLLNWYVVLGTYRKENIKEPVFFGAMLLSVGAFFYWPLIFYFVLMLVVLVVLHPIRWQDWVMSLFGMLLPFLYVFSGMFMGDAFVPWLQEIGSQELQFKFPLPKGSYSDWVGMVAGFLFLLPALYVHAGLMSTGKVKSQKSLTLLFWAFIISIPVQFLNSDFGTSSMLLFVPPLAVILSNFLLQLKSNFLSELSFWLIVTAGIVFRFQLLG